ncbi:hypothetical protein PG990_004277 [Apiospora arundinis]
MIPGSSEQQTESHELQSIPPSPQTERSATRPGPVLPTPDAAATAIAPPGPTRSGLSGSSGRPLSANPSQILAQSRTGLVHLRKTLGKFLSDKGDVLLKLITVLAFLVTAIAMWPSISSANDGHRAELIAEWTARKDFIESCQAVST